jgi:uncharacterized protein YjdB
MAVSFYTVVVPLGATARVPVTLYGTPGDAGKVSVKWTSSSSRVATPRAGAKRGALTWTAGKTGTLRVRARAVGATKITLRAPGATPLTVKIKVVSPKKVQRVAAIRLSAIGPRLGGGRVVERSVPAALNVGDSFRLKARPIPVSAVRVRAVWTSTNPEVVSVDQTGRLTARAPGSATVTCEVSGKTVRRSVIVR